MEKCIATCEIFGLPCQDQRLPDSKYCKTHQYIIGVVGLKHFEEKKVDLGHERTAIRINYEYQQKMKYAASDHTRKILQKELEQELEDAEKERDWEHYKLIIAQDRRETLEKKTPAK